jgi:hypothetical protein
MYDISIKRKAQALRKDGHGIREIAKTLELQPTTVSYWCRDIVLSGVLIQKIKNKGKKKAQEGLLKYGEKVRGQRMERTTIEKEAGKVFVGEINNRDIFMVGLGLYWGEGYKESNSELGFTNSNLFIIKFYMLWLSNLGVNKEDLIFRLTINEAYRVFESQVRAFWIKNLEIDDSQFSKTTGVKTHLKKEFLPDIQTYHGILRVKVRRGLKLKNMILGGIDALANK